MRVLLISHGLPPESVGGVEQHVDGIARALAERGHHVHVLAKSGRDGHEQGSCIDETPEQTGRATPYRVTRIVYRYEDLESLRSLYRVPAMDAAIEAFLDRTESTHGAFDAVHVHHLTGLSTGLLEVLKRRGTRTLMTLHDYWLLCPRGQMWDRQGRMVEAAEPQRCAECLHASFGGWVPEGAEGRSVVTERLEDTRALLDLPDQLITPSARAIPPFKALGLPADRIRVVENAVDTRRLRRVASPDFDPNRRLRIGFLGTLIPSKGLRILVRALLRLPPGQIELRIHGNTVNYHGDTGYLCRVFESLRPGDRVSYHGPYDDAQLPEILSEIDVLAAPALWREVFGLTAREALSAGRPVLVSNRGSLQDALQGGEAGLVLPAGDELAWAQAIDQLDRDRPRLQRMSEAARTVCAPRAFEDLAAELEGLYRGR
ncbi:MAG: glycosyltransferase family 4 protein [Planctomycetota bacterium]